VIFGPGTEVCGLKHISKKAGTLYMTEHCDDFIFTCKRCGEQLFTSELVMHDGNKGSWQEGAGVSSAKAKWAGTSPSAGNSTCTSVFVESPPAWLGCSDENEGRLACPKCSARVGSYSWSGSACSCGKWITPGFQFQLARVDAKSTGKIAPRPASA
jgi:dual specificity phosphatase 12